MSEPVKRDEKLAVAIHEVTHVLIAYVVGFDTVGISLRPDLDSEAHAVVQVRRCRETALGARCAGGLKHKRSNPVNIDEIIESMRDTSLAEIRDRQLCEHLGLSYWGPPPTRDASDAEDIEAAAED